MKNLKYLNEWNNIDFNKNYLPYPTDEMIPFIQWYDIVYDHKMKNEGWFILLSDAEHGYKKYGCAFWAIEKNDDANIIENDLIAEDLAKKTGLMVEEGIIIGYDGIIFQGNLPYMESFVEKLEKEKDAKKFGL